MKEVYLQVITTGGKHVSISDFVLDQRIDIFLDSNIEKVDLSDVAKFGRLQKFHINGESLTHINLLPLAHCTNLREINIDDSEQITQLDLTPLENCKKLQVLSLSDLSLKNLDLSFLKQCKKLQTITLLNTGLSEIDLTPLAQCKLLLKIQLDHSIIPCVASDLKNYPLPQPFEELKGKIKWITSQFDHVKPITFSSRKPAYKPPARNCRRFLLVNTLTIHCTICRRQITDKQPLAYCPGCQTPFHENHLAEAIKTNGKCPNCKERITVVEFSP